MLEVGGRSTPTSVDGLDEGRKNNMVLPDVKTTGRYEYRSLLIIIVY